jgi:hypothetical protein
MSFGPKLDTLPAAIAPGEEVIATLEFVPRFPDFQREVEVYVEDPEGLRTITFTVKSAPREPPS